MRELYHELTDWTLGLADNDWAIGLLALIAFSESVVFPIPPDPLLIAIGIASPESAIWVAAMVTLASVCGAFVGYWLGRKVGRPLLRRLISESKIERAEALFDRYGSWAILVAAFTPIPYKVFTILAGILGLEMKRFLIASLIGRGARFMTIGVLIFVFGESVREFIEGNFEIVTIACGGLLVLLIVAYVVGRRMRVPGSEAGLTGSGD